MAASTRTLLNWIFLASEGGLREALLDAEQDALGPARPRHVLVAFAAVARRQPRWQLRPPAVTCCGLPLTVLYAQGVHGTRILEWSRGLHTSGEGMQEDNRVRRSWSAARTRGLPRMSGSRPLQHSEDWAHAGKEGGGRPTRRPPSPSARILLQFSTRSGLGRNRYAR